jgi:hypothetical protein
LTQHPYCFVESNLNHCFVESNLNHCFAESNLYHFCIKNNLVSISGANRLGFFRFPYSRFPSTSALKKGRMFPPIGAREVLIFSFGMVWDFEKGFHQIHICDLDP